jgi:hypothetical protein
MGRMERQSSGFRDQLSVRQAHGAGAASAIPLPASRYISSSTQRTLFAVRTPLFRRRPGCSPDGQQRRPTDACLVQNRSRLNWQMIISIPNEYVVHCPSFQVPSGERGQPIGDGEIKRTGVRGLPSIAKACLHIGFCKFPRRQNGAVKGVQVPPYGLSL